MNSLLTYYKQTVQSGEILDSENQRLVLKKLDKISKRVHAAHQKKWWWPFRPTPCKGLYIYGPVGSGKTYLMDLFYTHLPEARKKRFHFHHLMQQVDKALRLHQGQQNPLQKIAAQLAEDAHVLCLDEFLVEDIADASILAELLGALFAHDVVVVATANTKPKDLYLNGLHRERFLPAIDLIETHTEVFCLNDNKDYRVGRVVMPEAYLYPVNKKNEGLMQQQFLKHTASERLAHGEITIQSREIEYIAKGEKSIWFDFNVICNMPRSQLDYLELSSRFDTVFVSHVRALKADELAQLVLFIRFVDVMYDEGIHLVILSAVPAEELYLTGPMSKTFERTLSRLNEMQSADYWQRVHAKHI